MAFVVLRLSPRDFWSMSPLELAAALSGLGIAPGHAFGRHELQRLMQQFPDGGILENRDGR